MNPLSGLQGQKGGKFWVFYVLLTQAVVFLFCFVFLKWPFMSVEVILLPSPSLKCPIMKARRIWLNRKHQQTAVDDRKKITDSELPLSRSFTSSKSGIPTNVSNIIWSHSCAVYGLVFELNEASLGEPEKEQSKLLNYNLEKCHTTND